MVVVVPAISRSLTTGPSPVEWGQGSGRGDGVTTPTPGRCPLQGNTETVSGYWFSFPPLFLPTLSSSSFLSPTPVPWFSEVLFSKMFENSGNAHVQNLKDQVYFNHRVANSWKTTLLYSFPPSLPPSLPPPPPPPRRPGHKHWYQHPYQHHLLLHRDLLRTPSDCGHGGRQWASQLPRQLQAAGASYHCQSARGSGGAGDRIIVQDKHVSGDHD